MSAPRGEFSSRFGFLMAAAGSAVGLGNIWGFPTNAASNGGAAFLFTYLVLAFALAYPALMAELIIGRHAKANAVTALRGLARGPATEKLGIVVGYAGMITVSLILCFYAIVSGWMMAFMFSAMADIAGLTALSQWLATGGLVRDSLFTATFMMLTLYVVNAGVRHGIEKWATRLMPALVFILLALIVYVMTLEGAMEGLRVYLVPDFSQLADTGLLLSAMGQAFFSLSLGVGTMLIYGSYVSKRENLPALGGMVTLLDIGIAVTAGLLILPAMYVALANGIEIYDAQGGLIAGPGLIIAVLPALFEQMGDAGILVALAFFVLMTIASLTSSISMLEVPVSYVVEERGASRRKAVLVLGLTITVISLLLVLNFDTLFDLVVSVTTEYSQPLLGFFFAVFVGWIWHRNGVLAEIKQGCPEAEQGLFWKIWPFYIRYICPLAILAVYAQMILG
ncbi:sodium-dependent transporter [Pseudohongiella sp.]|uniref:Transporter n=1 Tax=marine sediment metagenome TaxID=412755 RepID=A0A0F9VZQ9_9ZZZZ|nr:sodium-dependent transporter [Pseudohongiella sp.]HDZ10321.1 sodium-dependent transporter [Pseudohongiella sp.]HEA62056.1 sodium-dependent transporter [Pseudohongiella sp.]